MDTRSLLDNYSCEATPPQSEMGITSENGYIMASKGGGGGGGGFTLSDRPHAALVHELLADLNVR